MKTEEDPFTARPTEAPPPPLPAGETGKPATSSFRRLLRDIRELREYAAYYVTARKDRLTVSVRQAAIWAAMGLIGLLVLGAVLTTSVVLLLTGLAGGLASLFGEQPWLGPLVLGAGLLFLLAVAAVLALAALKRSFRRKTIEKYERRQARQRAEFGHDLSSRLDGRVPPSGTRV